jgi:hypothetical protein
MKHVAAWSLACLGLLAAPAYANFCKDVTTERARTEARLLENERYAAGAVDYVGDRAYNADIISCNRKRDSKGGELEKAIGPNHQFGANLEPRAIKGKYNYYATAPLAYAYELRREGNHWIVRVPMRFHWPTARRTDMIDISKELVDELADPALSSLCAAGSTVFEKNGKDVIRGYIPIRNPPTVQGTDTVGIDEEACRVPRSTRVADENILRHLRKFYANSLVRVWDRPGFRIEPVLLDHGEGAQAEINAWDKDGVTWELRLNLMPDHRASYKRWAFKWNNMYTGVPAHVIAHEFGHKLGLDDEYGWGPNVTRSQRDCANRRGTAPAEYIMCSQSASWDTSSTTDNDVHNGAKAVYPWIVTHRYAVGLELTCKEDSDCGKGNFCARGVLTLGRNECQALRPAGGMCDRDAQCNSERCVLGSCAAEHECLDDDECGDGNFCKLGLGDLDRNTCRSQLADWTACTGDKQCRSGECSGWRPQDGQTSGICYTASSKGSGESCQIDLECSTGACNSNKRCVCKSDDDCDGNQWCDKGADLHENSCRSKLDKGQACGKYGDLGVSRRCKSGKCSTKTGLGVPAVTTIYCQ